MFFFRNSKRSNSKRVARLYINKKRNSSLEQEIIVEKIESIQDSINDEVTQEQIDDKEYSMNDDDSDDNDDLDSDYVCSEEDDFDVNAVSTLQVVFQGEILKSSLKKHLKSNLGGGRKKEAITTLIGRISHFLAWMGTKLGCDKVNEIVVEILNNSYPKIVLYFEYINVSMNRKATTILSYVDDLLAYLNWFILFDGEQKQHELKGVESVLKSVRKSFKRLSRKESAAAHDIATQIKLKRWPEGGIFELITTVLGDLEWVNAINEHTVISLKLFRKFVKIMCASAYVSPQGRPQAVQDLRMSQLSDFQRDKYYLSSKLKTASKYGYQPVTGSDMYLTCLDKFVKYVRPQLKLRGNDLVFIDFFGKRLDIGSKVTAYFQQKLNLHITITTIRSVVETEMSGAHDRGEISTTERTALMNLNGHSSAITKDYYVRRDRQKDVQHAVSAFSVLSASPENNDYDDYDDEGDENDQNDEVTPTLSSKKRNHFFADDGNDESDEVISPTRSVKQRNQLFADYEVNAPQNILNKTQTRVKWSTAEITFVGEWCLRTLSRNPANQNNIVARCLEHIRSDLHIAEIFHPNHIVSSGRLKHGLECYKKLHDIQ
jgi:hypothetical protein